MPTAQPTPLAVSVNERDHAQGPPDAPVTLVEYGDYECPHCAAVRPIVREIQRQMGDQLRFVFRNFPVTTVHRHAMRAAEAAESAAAQGKFWEMHDLLLHNQQHLDDPDLSRYAQSIGLDVPRFERELAAHTHLPKVQEDFRGGMQSGVKSTPTFFINGARHTGSFELEPLLAAVRAGLG
ncbi:MAG TPA: thioredoxin domain-containing protein [Tepidisphaeraceae bacterium]